MVQARIKGNKSLRQLYTQQQRIPVRQPRTKETGPVRQRFFHLPVLCSPRSSFTPLTGGEREQLAFIFACSFLNACKPKVYLVCSRAQWPVNVFMNITGQNGTPSSASSSDCAGGVKRSGQISCNVSQPKVVGNLQSRLLLIRPSFANRLIAPLTFPTDKPSVLAICRCEISPSLPITRRTKK